MQVEVYRRLRHLRETTRAEPITTVAATQDNSANLKRRAAMDAKVSFSIPEEPENGETEEGTKYSSEGMKPADKRVQQLRGGRGRSGSTKSEEGSQYSRSETGRHATRMRARTRALRHRADKSRYLLQ